MREDHQFVFTHADMYHLNLLVENGRLSGIVDWECAGYWPEYWECVKAKAHARQTPVSEPIFNRVFGPTYVCKRVGDLPETVEGSSRGHFGVYVDTSTELKPVSRDMIIYPVPRCWRV